jgi:hypothetical protein
MFSKVNSAKSKSCHTSKKARQLCYSKKIHLIGKASAVRAMITFATTATALIQTNARTVTLFQILFGTSLGTTTVMDGAAAIGAGCRLNLRGRTSHR